MSRKQQFFLGNLGAVLLGVGLVGCGSGPTESADVSESAESATRTGSAEQIVLAIAGESVERYNRLWAGGTTDRPCSKVHC